MQAYSKEFRRDVLAACDAGGTTAEVALRFQVSQSWVRRIKQQRRETGQTAPKTKRKRRRKWEPWADWLRAAVAATPDAYLRELKVRLLKDRGVDVNGELIGVACHALKLSRKKRRSLPLNKTGTMSSLHARSGATTNP
jgi:transposase